MAAAKSYGRISFGEWREQRAERPEIRPGKVLGPHGLGSHGTARYPGIGTVPGARRPSRRPLPLGRSAGKSPRPRKTRSSLQWRTAFRPPPALSRIRMMSASRTVFAHAPAGPAFQPPPCLELDREQQPELRRAQAGRRQPAGQAPLGGDRQRSDEEGDFGGIVPVHELRPSRPGNANANEL